MFLSKCLKEFRKLNDLERGRRRLCLSKHSLSNMCLEIVKRRLSRLTALSAQVISKVMESNTLSLFKSKV